MGIYVCVSICTYYIFKSQSVEDLFKYGTKPRSHARRETFNTKINLYKIFGCNKPLAESIFNLKEKYL